MQITIRELKAWFRHLEMTPLHPQWHGFRHHAAARQWVLQESAKTVLDVGCGKQGIRAALEARHCTYIGIDHPKTAMEWYNSRPDVYADAHALPLRDGSVDIVVLLDVMEHLPTPDRALREAGRVLREDGTVMIQVPFLYPIHDAPLDFHRWTSYGLIGLATKSGFTVAQLDYYGESVECGAMLLNLALCKSVLNWLRGRRVAAVAVIFLPLLVISINVLGWVGGKMAVQDGFMAIGYRMVLRKGGPAAT